MIALHGGDIYTDGVFKNKQLIDFSSNINPYGVPNMVSKNIDELLEISTKYPDIKYRLLKQSIVEYIKKYYDTDIDIDNILLGNGAVEIIDKLIESVKSISIVAPSFIEYELIANKYNKEIKFINLDSDMLFDYNMIKDSLSKTEALIIANPNNPSGTIIDKALFKQVLDYCETTNKKIFIDEAFIEFTFDYMSFIKETKTYNCIFIIRAFTKFFGMPGVRLGYCISNNKDYINLLSSKQLAWNINCFAEYAAIKAFKDNRYILESKEWIKKESPYFIDELKSFRFIEKVYNTNCNFALCKLNTYSSKQLYFKMLQKNILIRVCDNFRNLGTNHIRLAIKTHTLNNILFDALKEL